MTGTRPTPSRTSLGRCAPGRLARPALALAVLAMVLPIACRGPRDRTPPADEPTSEAPAKTADPAASATPVRPGTPFSGLTPSKRVSPEDIRRAQSIVMDFVDDFSIRLADVVDTVEADLPTPESRLTVHRLKYTVAHGATVIGASANPRIGLLDMLVMISLQRALVDRRMAPELGEAGPRIAAVFASGESQIRASAVGMFSAEQIAEVDALIAQWLEQNPDRRFAAYVRLDDFAAARTQAVSDQGGGRPSSIFGLMFVDPLAGLDPATKEIEQTRLFAERAMFYLQRMPQLVSWQAELLYLDTATEPEVASLVDDVNRVTASIERATAEIAELRGGLEGLVARERKAAIDQAFDRLETERRALLDDLESRGPELDETLASLRETLESSRLTIEEARGLTAEAESLVAAVDELRAAMDSGEPDPDAGPEPTLDDYRATIEEARELTVQLTELIGAVESVATSDLWAQRRADMDAAADDVEARTRAVIDHAFTKGLILVGVALVGLLVVLVIVRLIPRPKAG